MRAVDTNVLVRLLVRDDEEQTQRAAALLRDRIEILPSVLLETEWVLRRVHDMAPRDIARAFRALLAERFVVVTSRSAIEDALRLFESGLDFADAMHAATATSSQLRTFDKDFVNRARRAKSRVKVEGV